MYKCLLCILMLIFIQKGQSNEITVISTWEIIETFFNSDIVIAGHVEYINSRILDNVDSTEANGWTITYASKIEEYIIKIDLNIKGITNSIIIKTQSPKFASNCIRCPPKSRQKENLMECHSCSTFNVNKLRLKKYENYILFLQKEGSGYVLNLKLYQTGNLLNLLKEAAEKDLDIYETLDNSFYKDKKP